jgi:pimeloyl-ACP methyl ester carboxylesterase
MNRLLVAGTALLHRPGDGPTLVLLHGIGSNAESWTPVMAELPAALNLLAWWAPGYGASAPVAAERPTPEDYAARLAEVLDGLRVARVALAGHSLGALFAARFAASRPERVTALALLSPALGYRAGRDAPLPPQVQARIDDLAALGPGSFAARRAARLLHAPETKPEVLAGVQRAMASVNLPGYAQAVHALGAGDLVADAARITLPALVACGAEDVVTPPGNARALHAALPAGSTLHLVPAAGHALPQEEPARIAALLAAMTEAAHA